MKILISLLLSGIFYGNMLAQTTDLTQNEDYIFWQPNTEIKFEDYKAKPDSSTTGFEVCQKFDYHTSTNIALKWVMDIPEKRGNRGKLSEKAYFAPAFCKKCSFITAQVPQELIQDKIYFDIAELAAREARAGLEAYVKETKASYGTISIMFAKVKDDADKLMRDLWAAYANDILVNKKVGAYEKWRTFLDEELKKREKYATNLDDCKRFLTDKPILEGYIMPEEIIGNIFQKKDN